METLEAPNETTDRLIDERETAKMLCIAMGTLSVWRSTKRYPLPYVRIGHCVRYSRAAVLKFIADGAVTPVRPPKPQAGPAPAPKPKPCKRNARPRPTKRARRAA